MDGVCKTLTGAAPRVSWQAQTNPGDTATPPSPDQLPPAAGRYRRRRRGLRRACAQKAPGRPKPDPLQKPFAPAAPQRDRGLPGRGRVTFKQPGQSVFAGEQARRRGRDRQCRMWPRPSAGWLHYDPDPCGYRCREPYMLKNQPYDVNKGLRARDAAGQGSNVFYHSPDALARNFQEFVAYARRTGQAQLRLRRQRQCRAPGDGIPQARHGYVHHSIFPYRGTRPATDRTCSRAAPGHLRLACLRGVHPPGKLRAIGGG